jgi:hypothetical protein
MLNDMQNNMLYMNNMQNNMLNDLQKTMQNNRQNNMGYMKEIQHNMPKICKMIGKNMQNNMYNMQYNMQNMRNNTGIRIFKTICRIYNFLLKKMQNMHSRLCLCQGESGPRQAGDWPS